MTSAIWTVGGPIAPESSGITLMHEHLFMDATRGGPVWAGHYIDDIADTLIDLQSFRALGGSTVVELTTRGIGFGTPSGFRRIAAATGLHIVKGTGWYTEPFYPDSVDARSVDELADILVSDLTRGMCGTDVRAGVIGEIGTGTDRITPREAKVLHAAASAQARTNAPVITHTHSGALAIEQIELLTSAGVPADRIAISHLDNRLDLGLVRELLASGAYAEFDAIGQEGYAAVTDRIYPTDEERVRAIAELIGEGWVERLLLSSDTCSQRHLLKNGGNGRRHVLRRFLPLLVEAGVGKTDIDTMLIANPRALLSFDGKEEMESDVER